MPNGKMVVGLVLWIALQLWLETETGAPTTPMELADGVAQVVQGSGENMVLASMKSA